MVDCTPLEQELCRMILLEEEEEEGIPSDYNVPTLRTCWWLCLYPHLELHTLQSWVIPW